MALKTVDQDGPHRARRPVGSTGAKESLERARSGVRSGVIWLPGALAGDAPGADGAEDSRVDARKRRGRARGVVRVDPLPALGLGVGILLAWQLMAAAGAVPAFLLPSPLQVAQAFLFGLGSLSATFPWYTPGLLPQYAVTTLIESAAGFALGTLVALPLGYGIARSRLLARALQPYLAASQAIPAVALAPLLVIWLGYGCAAGGRALRADRLLPHGRQYHAWGCARSTATCSTPRAWTAPERLALLRATSNCPWRCRASSRGSARRPDALDHRRGGRRVRRRRSGLGRAAHHRARPVR